MSVLWIAAAGFLVWYLVTHKEQRLVWPWVGLGVLALPLLGAGHLFGGGMMGRGGMGGGMMGRGGMGQGMMGRGGMGQGMMGRGGMGHGMMSQLADTTWWWVPMAIHAVIVIALVVIAVVVLVKVGRTIAKRNTPLGLLQMRLAKGEITAEEFESLRSKLQG